MAEMIFKSFRDLQEYLVETEMLDLEELTDTILQEPKEQED